MKFEPFERLAGIIIVFLLGVLYLISFWLSDTAHLVSRFSDDSYYYLVIARNVVAKGIFTFDQITPTNGFQPLWQVILLPIFHFSQDRLMILRIIGSFTVILLTMAGLFGVIRLPRRIPLSIFALCIGLLLRFLSNFYALSMETTIVVPILLLTIFVVDNSLTKSFAHRKIHELFILGLLLALLEMARLDAVFFVAVILIMLVYIEVSPGGILPALRNISLVAFPPTLVGIIYLVINFKLFGHFIPVSGVAKSALHPELNHKIIDQMFRINSVGDIISPRIVYSSLLVICSIYIAYAIVRTINSKERKVWIRYNFAPIAVSVATMLIWLYNLLATSWQVWEWYYYPAPLIIVTVIPAFASIVTRSISRFIHTNQITKIIDHLIAYSIFFALLLQAIDAGYWVHRSIPSDFLYQNYLLAEQLNQKLGDADLLSMGDRAGSLAYFWKGRLLQLEGLVGSYDLLTAIRKGELQNYLDQMQVNYVIAYGGPSNAKSEYTLVIPLPSLSNGPNSQILLCPSSEYYRTQTNSGLLQIWRWPSCR